jgi:hypothetical protein
MANSDCNNECDYALMNITSSLHALLFSALVNSSSLLGFLCFHHKMNIDETIKILNQQNMIENFQLLISQMTPKCYKMCIQTPGLQLSGREEDCLDMCKENYGQAYQLISQRFINQITTKMK